MQVNSFDNGLRCKLYSDIEKIIHPTISKKNISNYRIVLTEEVVPVRVFYPEKVSQIDHIIIYIHGISSVSLCNGHYSDICMELAINSGQLVIAVDYDEEKRYLEALNDCSNCVKYLCDELLKFGISINHITLVGDSIGATMAIGVNRLLDGFIQKSILISPVLSDSFFYDIDISKNDRGNCALIHHLTDYYRKSLRFKKNYKDPFVFPLLSKDSAFEKALLIVGEYDALKNEIIQYSDIMGYEVFEIPLVGHGFLRNMVIDTQNTFYTNICYFLKQ